MAALSRVLSTATKRGFQFERLFCTISNPFLNKLIQLPISSIKTTLDDASESIAMFNSSQFSWDEFLISLNSSSPHKAQLVLEWKLAKLLKDKEKDYNHFSHLISLCGKIQNFQFALLVFSSMEADGIKPNFTIFNALIHTCLSSSNLTTALSLYQIMMRSDSYNPNSDTYNLFIFWFSKMGNYMSMQAWYSAKLAAGFLPDIQTYECLISTCVRMRNFEAAQRFYEETVSFDLVPSISILENMIYILCKQRCLDKIKDFVMSIRDSEWAINGKIVNMLTDSYFGLGSVDELEDLLLNLMRSNQVSDTLSELHYGIIRMYVKLDKLNDVEYAVGRMLKQGISFAYEDDVEKVICLYFKCEAYDRLELFLESIKGTYKLTLPNYNLLIAGYRRGGLSEKLRLLITDLNLAGY